MMNRPLKVAAGVMLILLFSPVVIGAIVLAALAIPGYRFEPGFISRILGLCFLFGLPSLFACMAGAQLVRRNLTRSCSSNGEHVVDERRWRRCAKP